MGLTFIRRFADHFFCIALLSCLSLPCSAHALAARNEYNNVALDGKPMKIEMVTDAVAAPAPAYLAQAPYAETMVPGKPGRPSFPFHRRLARRKIKVDRRSKEQKGARRKLYIRLGRGTQSYHFFFNSLFSCLQWLRRVLVWVALAIAAAVLADQ